MHMYTNTYYIEWQSNKNGIMHMHVTQKSYWPSDINVIKAYHCTQVQSICTDKLAGVTMHTRLFKHRYQYIHRKEWKWEKITFWVCSHIIHMHECMHEIRARHQKALYPQSHENVHAYESPLQKATGHLIQMYSCILLLLIRACCTGNLLWMLPCTRRSIYTNYSHTNVNEK